MGIDFEKLNASIGIRREQRELDIMSQQAVHKDPLVEAMKGTIQRTQRRIELNMDQEKALSAIVDWVNVDDVETKPAYVLQGYAGTGKSTLMRELVREYPVGSVALCAPTNKATKVLRSMLESEGLIAPCLTIQSANGLRLSDDLPEKYLTRAGKSTFKLYKLVVVDEASMVGERMAEMILEEALVYGTKVLFVGDPMQLPPVKDGQSPAFNGRLPTARLEHIMRQAETNPIIAFGKYFRDLLGERIRPNTQFQQTADGVDGVHYLTPSDFWDRYSEAIRDQSHPDENRGLCFTNNAVQGMAQQARKLRYGDASVWHVGERIYTVQPIDHGTVGMYTDQEADIEELHPYGKHPSFPDFEAQPVVLTVDSGEQCFAYIPTPASEEAVKKHIEERYKAAADLQQGDIYRRQRSQAWKDYHKFKDAWADIRSVFALTTHRSQGSTFDNVFIHGRDIASCKDPQVRWRLFYVASTRARRNVYFLR